MLPPVPNFNDASVREDILAELAQQETLLQQLQIMEELYADELELGKLLSRLELDDKPEVLPPSKTAICYSAIMCMYTYGPCVCVYIYDHIWRV